MSAILKTEIRDIRYKNPFNIGEYDHDKESEFDIQVETDTKIYEIEMQLQSTPAFSERLVYYGAKLLSGTVDKGDDYSELKESVVIAILDFSLFKDNDYYSEFCFREKSRNTVLSEILRIITLEMVKLKENKSVKEMTETERWLTYLKYVGEKGYEKKIEEIIKESEAVQMADTILREVSADERMRSILHSREKFEKDMLTRMNFARKEGVKAGMQKGIQQGIQQGKQEGIQIGVTNTIKILLEMNMDRNEIIKTVSKTYGISSTDAQMYYEKESRPN